MRRSIIYLIGFIIAIATVSNLSGEGDYYKIQKRIEYSVLRILIDLKYDPLFYMDLPESGMRLIVCDQCNSVLQILKEKPVPSGKLIREVNKLAEEIKQMKERKFIRPIPEKRPSRVQYNYFSADS